MAARASLRLESEGSMSKADIPEEVDFRGGKRGVHAARYASGTNVVVLDPDVAKRFKSSEQVNRVLRTFIEAAAEIGPARRPSVPEAVGSKTRRRTTRG